MAWVAAIERTDPDVRQLVMVAYLLCAQRDLHHSCGVSSAVCSLAASSAPWTSSLTELGRTWTSLRLRSEAPG